MAGGYLTLLILASIGFNIWLPSCPFDKFFRVECFGCGLNHAAVSLLQLQWRSAFESNYLIFIFLPVMAYMAGNDFFKYHQKQEKL